LNTYFIAAADRKVNPNPKTCVLCGPPPELENALANWIYIDDGAYQNVIQSTYRHNIHTDHSYNFNWNLKIDLSKT